MARFGVVPPSPFHRLSHLSLYQQTLGTLALFQAVSVFFYHRALCHPLLFHVAYQKITSCFILHLCGPAIVWR